MYVLDTNTLIYFFKGMGEVANQILSHSPKDLAIPAVALYEIEVGIAKSESPRKRREQLTELTSRIAVLPFGERESIAAASIRVQLESEGRPIGPLDNLIAGAAMASHGILVTHNTRKFQRITDLKIEDWY